MVRQPAVVLRGLSSIIAIVVASTGVAVLAGWAFDIQFLKSLTPTSVSMKPNTAVALVLAGCSLWPRGTVATPGAKILAIAIALTGFLTLLQYLLGWNLGIDQILFSEAVNTSGTSAPGRMSPLTACCFVLLGTGLASLDLEVRGGRRPAQWLAVLAGAATLLPLVGYLLGAPRLYGIGQAAQIAPHTAIALLLLSLGVLFARPDRGFMASITSETAVGALTRRLIPVLIGLPVAVAWVFLQGERAGYYQSELRAALVAVTNVVALVGVTSWMASLHRRTEIRERKATASLSETEQDLLTTLECIGDAVVSTDLQGRVVRMNPMAETLTGWNRNEAAGRPLGEVFNIINEETRAPVESPVDHVLREGTVVGLANHTILISKDGSEHAIADSAAPIVDAHRTVRGVVLVFRDASEARKVEVATRASEQVAVARSQTLQAILDSVADGVVVVDQAGTFTHWNPAADWIMAGAQEGPPETWSKTFGLFRNDKITPVPASELPLVRAMQGESVTNAELFVRYQLAPEGRWLSVNARPLVGGGGAVAVFRDTTAERELHSQVMISERMASVGTLAAGVAHEINNPLAVVVANLSFAQEVEASLRSGPLPTKDLEDCIRDGKEAAERIRLIVKDLKIFSRVEEDKRSAVSAEHVMESAVRMAWNEIRHRAHLVKRYGKVPLVDVNESRLGQVFLNLLVNAAQALPEGQADVHEITILLRTAADGRVVVEVHDSGPGIPPEILGKLFTPFFSTKPAGVGTGLGLAICQRIVAGMGGGIDVESEVGKGTTFRVTLPATTMMATEEMVAPVVRPASRRGRILVVDDEEAIRLVVRRALGKAHDVIACASAQEALEKIAAGESFDIILSDLMMPVMSGVEFYQRLVVVSPEHVERVVFLTGGAFTPSARNFLDEVPNARLNKPFEIQNLRGLVNDRLR